MNAHIEKMLGEAEEIAAVIITRAENRYGMIPAQFRPLTHAKLTGLVFVDMTRERQQHQQFEMAERSVFVADEMLRVMQNRR